MIANDPVREQLLKLLLEVNHCEEEFEAMRQTLCQELMFNLEDVMRLFTRQDSLTAPDLHVQLKSTTSIAAVQSMIRHYNDNQLTGFTKERFGRIFLTRQNRLLAKLVSSRASHGQLHKQEALLSYIHKIIEKELQLHEKVVEFKRSHLSRKQEVQFIIGGLTDGQLLDQQKLKQFLKQRQPQCSAENVVEYFEVSPRKEPKFVVATFRNTLITPNCEEISSYLTKKVKQKHAKSNSKLRSPYVHDEFHKLLREPQRIDKMSYRQVQSIWTHLKRINSTRRLEISEKIDEYRRKIEREVKELCISLKDIIWLEKEVEYARVELALCIDFHPRVFFNSFCLERNGKLIASSMQEYLRKVGVDGVKISDVYLLFKRFACSPDGKLSCEQFASIFQPAQQEYRDIKKTNKPCALQDTSNGTKIAYVDVLRVTLRNESMIQRIRQHLFKRPFFDIRNIFNCMDADEDGLVSILDLRVLIQRYLELELSKFDVQLLMRRLSKRSPDDMITYEEFAYEFAPRQNTTRRMTSPTSSK